MGTVDQVIDTSEPKPFGRPPKYQSPEEMQAIIDVYFQTDAFVSIGESKAYCPTIAGLAYALDLSRQGLLNYQGRADFFDTIKKAKQRVEVALEQRLYAASPVGTIFNLKNNFDWKDKQETELTGKDGGPLEMLLKEISGSVLGPRP